MTEPVANSVETAPPLQGSIYRHMLRGSLWALGQNFSIRLIGLFNTVILARLLSPDDFGVVTMASMVLGLLNSFVDLGPSGLLIRQPVATKEHCDTAWTFSFLRGVAVAVLLAILSPWIADFFRDDRVLAITLIFVANSLILNAFSIGLVLMRMELNFAAGFYFDLASRLVVLVVTLGLAFWWRSYWAIVVGTLVGNVFGFFLSFKIHPYRARFSFAKAREYFNFSLVMIPLNAAHYLTGRVDTFVVGRMSAAAALGVYNVAAELATMLTIDLTQQISRGLYPNYAKLTSDPPKLIEAYLSSLSALATVSIAFGLGLWAVAQDFTIVILGTKWLDAIPLLRWLAIGGILRGIDYGLGSAILMVTGHERVSAVLMWIRVGVYTAASIIGGMWNGQIGVAIGVFVGAAMLIPVVIFSLIRCFNLRISDFIKALWRPVIAGLGMVIAVRVLYPDGLLVPGVRLFIAITVGAIAFVVTLIAAWQLSGRPSGIESRVIGFLFPNLKTIRN